jgi:hypothetical protein
VTARRHTSIFLLLCCVPNKKKVVSSVRDGPIVWVPALSPRRNVETVMYMVAKRGKYIYYSK